MATVQLLVRDEANRRALAAVLEDHHTVITDQQFVEADLYLVDDASLPRYQEPLEAHKETQNPLFCPVILIRRERTSIQVDLPPPDQADQYQLVNEMVRAPVEKRVLLRRMANLLVQRRQTRTLREQNERLEQFASILRHELRNPLQILEGNIEFLYADGDEAAFERCSRAIRKMNRLLEETLLITDYGKLDIETNPVGLAAICERAWELAAETDAELEIENSAALIANVDRLEQLLWNLFRNALEHAGEDVQVTVGTLPNGFFVEDDGPGIAPSEREIVFREGYTTAGDGTGFGLAVVEAVADVHEWDVAISQGESGGARFEFTGVDFASDASPFSS